MAQAREVLSRRSSLNAVQKDDMTNDHLSIFKKFREYFSLFKTQRKRALSETMKKQRRSWPENERVLSYSALKAGGFLGYTFEISEALKEFEKEDEEEQSTTYCNATTKQFIREQKQRDQCFEVWLSDYMKKERELFGQVQSILLKNRDDMLQEVGPDWYQQLSIEQMELLNRLDKCVRYDHEEGRTDNISALVEELGLAPVPSSVALRRASRKANKEGINGVRFLWALLHEIDKTKSRDYASASPKIRTGFEFTPSERIILSSVAHLRTPDIICRLEKKFGAPDSKISYFKHVRGGKTGMAREVGVPYLEPQPTMKSTSWLELMNANYEIYQENLYINSHSLPPTLFKGLPEVQKCKTLMENSSQESKITVDENEPKPNSPAVQSNKEWKEEDRKQVSQSKSSKDKKVSAFKPKQYRKNKKRKLKSADNKVVDLASVQEVLATMASEGDFFCKLPDVHKLPAIQKWIRLRNGLKYLHRQLDNLLMSRSKLMWRALMLRMAYRVPTPRHRLTLEEVQQLTYDQSEWYRARINRFMTKYNTALKQMLVNCSREMFPSMACDFFHSRDKFLRTYFAYMPAKESMALVKPWFPAEFNKKIEPLWRARYRAKRMDPN